jgi:hypothetical protein
LTNACDHRKGRFKIITAPQPSQVTVDACDERLIEAGSSVLDQVVEENRLLM